MSEEGLPLAGDAVNSPEVGENRPARELPPRPVTRGELRDLDARSGVRWVLVPADGRQRFIPGDDGVDRSTHMGVVTDAARHRLSRFLVVLDDATGTVGSYTYGFPREVGEVLDVPESRETAAVAEENGYVEWWVEELDVYPDVPASEGSLSLWSLYGEQVVPLTGSVHPDLRDAPSWADAVASNSDF